MSQTMKLVGSSCLFILAVFCAVARSAEAAKTDPLRVTVAGEKCSSTHPCGKHTYNYFWCYKSVRGLLSGKWDYCCKPDHPCGTHGYNYNWCYNGYSWSYCDKEEVTTDKTVSGKFCLSGESCGQHGYSYNWCYVHLSWDYCCKPDHACATHGYSYNWCRFGYWSNSWSTCVP